MIFPGGVGSLPGQFPPLRGPDPQRAPLLRKLDLT